MNVSAPIDALPQLPRDEEGPTFREPWEAQAFAMTLRLYEAGHFTWSEWAEYLSVEIASAPERGDQDLGDTYYHHWLRALEKIVADKSLTSPQELLNRKQAWDHAARHTEHGKPIKLAE